MRKSSPATPVRRSWLPALVVASSLMLVGGAQAGPSLFASPKRHAVDRIVGSWELYGGGVVRVTGSGATFTGKVVEAAHNTADNAGCTYSVGDVIWKITGKSGQPLSSPYPVLGVTYIGTMDWFRSCKEDQGRTRHRDGAWQFVNLNGEAVIEACTPLPGHTFSETGFWRSCDYLRRAAGSRHRSRLRSRSPRRNRSRLRRSRRRAAAGSSSRSHLESAGAAASPPFRVCLTKPGSKRILCFTLRKGRTQTVKNHGKTVAWPVGTKLRVCEDERAGWITPDCQTLTIRKGANRTTIVNRRDTSPPVIRAFEYDAFASPGEKVALQFTVKDDSGHAKVHNNVYQGGRRIGGAATPLIAADGKRVPWNATVTANLIGPLYFCLWAEDAAGNRSSKTTARTSSRAIPAAAPGSPCWRRSQRSRIPAAVRAGTLSSPFSITSGTSTPTELEQEPARRLLRGRLRRGLQPARRRLRRLRSHRLDQR